MWIWQLAQRPLEEGRGIELVMVWILAFVVIGPTSWFWCLVALASFSSSSRYNLPSFDEPDQEVKRGIRTIINVPGEEEEGGKGDKEVEREIWQVFRVCWDSNWPYLIQKDRQRKSIPNLGADGISYTGPVECVFPYSFLWYRETSLEEFIGVGPSIKERRGEEMANETIEDLVWRENTRDIGCSIPQRANRSSFLHLEIE